MIRCSVQGSFKKTIDFLNRNNLKNITKILEKYGQLGVDALSSATPVNTGETAKSWYFTVTNKNGIATISWNNSNTSEGIPIVVLIQYGHVTRNGGYVQGRDFINPAIRPILDKLASDAWKEVASSK